MANTYSALKRVRQTERRTEVNRKNKSRLRHSIRAMRRALTAKDVKAASELLPETFVRFIDQSQRALQLGFVELADRLVDLFGARSPHRHAQPGEVPLNLL